MVLIYGIISQERNKTYSRLDVAVLRTLYDLPYSCVFCVFRFLLIPLCLVVFLLVCPGRLVCLPNMEAAPRFGEKKRQKIKGEIRDEEEEPVVLTLRCRNLLQMVTAPRQLHQTIAPDNCTIPARSVLLKSLFLYPFCRTC